MKLERLSTVGDVEVSRDYSWASVHLSTGSNILSKAGGTGNLNVIFAVGGLVKVGEEVHVISSVGTSVLNTIDYYSYSYLQVVFRVRMDGDVC